MTEGEGKIRRIQVKLDLSKLNYVGPMLRSDILEDEESYFREPLIEFYSPFFVISHDGNADFTLYFAHLDTIKGAFICDFIAVFSFGEILSFLNSLKRGIKNEDFKDLYSMEKEVMKPDESKEFTSLGLSIEPKSRFYSPNRYFHFATHFGHKIFFGRKMGEKDSKEVVFYNFSVTLPPVEVPKMIDTIEKNISKFEENNDVKLKDLVVKKSGESK
jgi:hypothetical protein